MTDATENSLSKAWQWILVGAPLWWILGLNLLIYHGCAVICLAILLHHTSLKEKVLYVPVSTLFMLGIMVVYLFSIVLHISQHPFSRTMAAFYNLSFWGMGFCLTILISNLFSLERMKRMLHLYVILAAVSCLVTLVAIALSLQGVNYFSFKTPLYELGIKLSETVLVKNSVVVNLLHKDWFVSLWRPRLNLYAPYPTAAGGTLVVFLSMLTTWAVLEGKKKLPWYLILALGTLIALFMTLSRMAILSLVVSAIFIFVAEKKKVLPWVLLALTLLIFLIPVMDQALTAFLKMREGSNESRIQLYLYSMQQLSGIDWVLGLGIKPRADFSNFPIGSHSTYVSLLFKTGLLGFLTFLGFQAYLFTKWYKLKTNARKQSEYYQLWRCFGFILIAMSFWMLTEDIDAPQLLAFIYFSVVGCLEGMRRELGDV